MMPFDEVPAELLYAILNYLGADEDYQSLYACASTCRALVSPAQTHIFHTISLYREDPTLLSILEATPRIRTFIKRLRLFEAHGPWIKYSVVMDLTLEMLAPYVTSLCIHQQRRKPAVPRFDLSSLWQLRCVEEIVLGEEVVALLAGLMYGDDALLIFLSHFPNLRAITFDQCSVRNQIIGNISDVAAPVFRLERLDVRRCYDALVLDWLAPALSSLQTLDLTYPAPYPSFSSTTVPHFMTTAGESLQHLEVRGLKDASDTDLQSLMTAVRTKTINLRSLGLSVGTTFKHSPIELIVQSLLLIDAHTHLQRIIIGFYQDDDLVINSPWESLQDLLLGTRFPALQSVEFRLSLNSPKFIPVATELFVSSIPRLAQKGIISVRYE